MNDENEKRQRELQDPILEDDVPQRKQSKTINEYTGFSFQDPRETPVVDRIEGKDATAKKFFDGYISKRRPVVMNFIPKLPNGKDICVTKDILDKIAGDKEIQVERRNSISDTYGQNRTTSRQVLLTVSDLLERLCADSSELLYWSTQEDTDDPFNTPCRQLLDHGMIPRKLEMSGNLILSSCNMWIGRAANGASSGLHHDYHDNFYLLLSGRKRFRLFSPDCAPKLSTFGTIDRIHCNGRISYVGSEARADGVPLDSLQEVEDEHDDDEEEEEEVVLGKGFDYVSDSDGGDSFQDGVDDYEELVGNLGGSTAASVPQTEPQHVDMEESERPDSFSRIDVAGVKRHILENRYPSFSTCREVFVELKAGQTLYLPAGWFHEVTSFSSHAWEKETGDLLSNCHVAINYWYHPPDALENFHSPYVHDFWAKEESHERKSQ